MLAVLSPAKTLDFDTPATTKKSSQPRFVDESGQLIRTLRRRSPDEISSLMGISDQLAELNSRRYQEWRSEFQPGDAKQAALAFKGDVYLGLEAHRFSERDLSWAQKRLRILSGLHGLLRPLDLIHPYRLEMGTSLKTKSGANLYDFWGEKVTEALNEDLSQFKRPALINLASNEYFKVLQRDAIQARIVDVKFLDLKNGQYKFLSFFAKKARGLMAAYMVANRSASVASLKRFDWHGYRFSAEQSHADEWVFLRDEVTDYRG